MTAEYAFFRRAVEIERAHETISRVAGNRRFLVDRLIFTWHGYKISKTAPRELVGEYLAHLGYSAIRIADFPEIPTERALAFIDALWRNDFARNEDLLPHAAATTCSLAIRDAVEPWAILAFTNLLQPEPPPYAPERLFGERFIPVLPQKGAEAGFMFVGEEDIALVWFDDDDGPTRSIWSYSEHQRATMRRK